MLGRRRETDAPVDPITFKLIACGCLTIQISTISEMAALRSCNINIDLLMPSSSKQEYSHVTAYGSIRRTGNEEHFWAGKFRACMPSLNIRDVFYHR